MNLSLCITTYNRYEMTIESFAKVIDDPRIDDIIILDDASTDGSGEKLRQHFIDNEKVNMLFQVDNKGMSLNKRDAIKHAKNEWCIIFDSDNIIDTDYLDAFYAYVTSPITKQVVLGENRYGVQDFKTIFCPDFAKPKFDYTRFNGGNLGQRIDKSNAFMFIQDDQFNCLLNTCNYIVNRDWYLDTYEFNPDHVASDTIWHNYNHLKAGGNFHIVPGMQYYHRVHAGSGFLQNAATNIARAEQVRLLIQSL